MRVMKIRAILWCKMKSLGTEALRLRGKAWLVAQGHSGEILMLPGFVHSQMKKCCCGRRHTGGVTGLWPTGLCAPCRAVRLPGTSLFLSWPWRGEISGEYLCLCPSPSLWRQKQQDNLFREIPPNNARAAGYTEQLWGFFSSWFRCSWSPLLNPVWHFSLCQDEILLSGETPT